MPAWSGGGAGAGMYPCQTTPCIVIPCTPGSPCGGLGPGTPTMPAATTPPVPPPIRVSIDGGMPSGGLPGETPASPSASTTIIRVPTAVKPAVAPPAVKEAASGKSLSAIPTPTPTPTIPPRGLKDVLKAAADTPAKAKEERAAETDLETAAEKVADAAEHMASAVAAKTALPQEIAQEEKLMETWMAPVGTSFGSPAAAPASPAMEPMEPQAKYKRLGPDVVIRETLHALSGHRGKQPPPQGRVRWTRFPKGGNPSERGRENLR